MKRVLLSLALLLAAAPLAAAQSLLIFSWQTVPNAQAVMEKEKKPGIFFFEAFDVVKDSFNWNFSQSQIQAQAKKFACAKIQPTGQNGAHMYGSYQKLADKYGVGQTSTLVVLSYDGAVLATISTVVKRDELEITLAKLAAANTKRLKDSEAADRDLDQVEKWIEEKKWADAVRRAGMVAAKGMKIDQKIIDRATDLETKLKKICTEQIDEVKAIVDDPAKKAEAKAALKEIIAAFGKYEEAKEARELLKKVD
jgi:thioredoxin-related protein